MTDEKGRLVWISAARPGRTHDITAARCDHRLAHMRDAGFSAPADLGFLGRDDAPAIPWSSPATRSPAPASSRPARRRPTGSSRPDAPPVEHGFAHLKNWRILTKRRTTAPPAPPSSCAPCSS
ncbi:hypothetical protein ACIQ9Q_24020 [Streptomyces sp. NPDC094438]|uniref:hypothetical protein n=1 Tax=Streptomyces sp. NPDC094438 TaxID=3366061 RepID=UPI00382ADD60